MSQSQHRQSKSVSVRLVMRMRLVMCRWNLLLVKTMLIWFTVLLAIHLCWLYKSSLMAI